MIENNRSLGQHVIKLHLRKINGPLSLKQFVHTMVGSNSKRQCAEMHQ